MYNVLRILDRGFMSTYLKSLDLLGFKSFAAKTHVAFAEGITGIVGSNGCGKSNIVEAIKWVLGEQSAKSLRGDKMQDVIFSGTKHRQASGMAEVVLTFNNEQGWLPMEYPEVAVSRRLFRSGEGQYYINGARTRLKDNVELFLDTGIGRDSYAIFEQGKIDRILFESAEDRRVLFEDFAGISKFKFRKEEAEKKLAMARENLERLQETLTRLEKEIAALELQAKDAEAYKETRMQLDGCELKFGAARLKNMRTEIEKRQKERDTLHGALKPLEQDLLHIENQQSKSEEGSSEKETHFQQLNERYHRLEKELAQSQTQRNSAEKRLDDVKRRAAELEIRSKQDRERLEDGEEELAEKRDAVAEAEKKEASARKILEQAESLQQGIKTETEILEAALLKDSLALGYNRAVTRSDSEIIRKEITELKGMAYHYESEMIRQEDLHKSKSSALKGEEQSLSGLRAAFEHSKTSADALRIQKTDILQNIAAKETEIKGLEARQKNLLEQSKSCDKQILSALEKSLAGIRNFKNIRPNLENALNAALSAVEMQVKAGRPLDVQEFDSLKSALGQSAKAHAQLADSLFGEDFTQKLALLDENDAVLFSLEALRKELEGLKSQAEILSTQESEALSLKNKAENEFKNAEREYKKLQSDAEQAQIAAGRAQSDHFNTKQKADQADSRLNALEQAIQAYDEGHSALRDRRIAVQEEVGNARVLFTGEEALAKALRSDVRSLEIRLDDLRRSLGAVDGDRHRLDQEQASLKEEIEELLSSEDEWKPEISRLQEQMRAAAEEMQEIGRAKKALEAMYRDATEKYNKLRLRESEIEGALAERRQAMDFAEQSLKEQFRLEEISVELSAEDTLENLQGLIKNLKEQLARMGDINLLAVEQYQGAKEKFAELTRQKEDIEAAAIDTETLIAQTNAESAEKFMKAFDDIRRSFRELFAQLSDGGRADLILLDKTQPLSSGIDILAEPPGQKFQSVSLLSGGQRAMVAIAVIFSMLKLKPTPFIILDEMDAPLDDENIERFKELLRRFKNMGQFVIVSHSKSTLEVCDVLFGVTMEEEGCSKVLSVAFDEADKLIFQ